MSLCTDTDNVFCNKVLHLVTCQPGCSLFHSNHFLELVNLHAERGKYIQHASNCCFSLHRGIYKQLNNVEGKIIFRCSAASSSKLWPKIYQLEGQAMVYECNRASVVKICCRNQRQRWRDSSKSCTKNAIQPAAIILKGGDITQPWHPDYYT